MIGYVDNLHGSRRLRRGILLLDVGLEVSLSLVLDLRLELGLRHHGAHITNNADRNIPELVHHRLVMIRGGRRGVNRIGVSVCWRRRSMVFIIGVKYASPSDAEGALPSVNTDPKWSSISVAGEVSRVIRPDCRPDWVRVSVDWLSGLPERGMVGVARGSSKPSSIL